MAVAAKTSMRLRDTRGVILDAAEMVVMREGVRNMTLDAVAAEAGVSKGGLLYHFPSKEDLAVAMIERSIDWFDAALAEASKDDAEPQGRYSRAYIRASLGRTALTGAGFDGLCSAITTALLSYPEKLKAVREQGRRAQADFEADGLDPVLATIIRLAVDGLWFADNFQMMRYDPAMKEAVTERLLAWTRKQGEFDGQA
jgi:AcrR family transcriptional regulator